ncbi:ATP-binding protein [Jannaschia aquimarina]|nr:ATP-binding protein [Jannaschia aquimarina]
MPAPLIEMLNALADPAMLLDDRGRVAATNAAAKDRFGAWVEGQSYISVLRQPGLLAPVENAFFSQQSGTARFIHVDGAVETAFEVGITPLASLLRNGRSPVMLIFRDVSEQGEGAAMRRDFVANVSHELKTPLTAMIGYVETLQGPAQKDEEAQRRFLAHLGQELSRMNRLVVDLLSLSRLEGQSRRKPRDRVDLVALLSEVVGLLAFTASDQQVELVLDTPERADVFGDADQLTQVVANLVENAIKYGRQPGTVRVDLDYVQREPVLRGPAWRMSVIDDGPGIAAEHLPRLTERFYRVDTGRSRQQGGTGLGLAIVKHIVNRHRGRLKIESKPGEGTRIGVTLPAATEPTLS